MAGSEYAVRDHGLMLADRNRIEAFRRALEQVVRPGDVVIDIGTGVGLFALMACALGARRVHAIEPAEAIEVAREIARVNGMADRIEFHRALSMDVSLPAPADVVVADVHGSLPIHGRALETLIDARRRLLRPGGTLIPLRDRLWAAPVELPSEDYDRVAIWLDRRWRFDLSPGARFATDSLSSISVPPASLLAEPMCVCTLDYTTLDSTTVSATTSFTVNRRATGHGLALWFDCDLTPDVTLSPGLASRLYRVQLLPWSRPIDLLDGDRVSTAVQCSPAGDTYLWSWGTTIESAIGERRANFRQSTFWSSFISPASLGPP